MAKAITSTNPLKAVIVKHLKAKSGATRVTCVRQEKDEDGNVIYTGHCLGRSQYRNRYATIGKFSVTEQEIKK